MWLDKEGWHNPSGTGVAARTAPSREALGKDIRDKVNAEFDRVARSIQDGSNKFRGLDAAEIATLVAILEEKRAAVFAEEGSPNFIEHWQHGLHRVQTMFGADDRVKTICEARSARRRSPEPGPVRYLGFDDGGGNRTYKFARLPPADDAKTYCVRVPLALMAEHNLSLQDGPAFCVLIMAANPDPADYTATEEDARKFLATLPVKTIRKPWKRPRPAESATSSEAVAPETVINDTF